MSDQASSYSGTNGCIVAITAAQLGCTVGALLFQAYANASDSKRDLLAAPGGHLRNLVGAVLGWDEHRRLHDTVAIWGPLMLVVALVAASLPLVRPRRLAPPLEGALNLFGPWIVLALTTHPSWRATGLWFLVPVIFLWLHESGLLPRQPQRAGHGRARWSLLLSVPLWVFMLRDINAWVAPLGGLSVLLGLARAVLTVQGGERRSVQA